MMEEQVFVTNATNGVCIGGSDGYVVTATSQTYQQAVPNQTTYESPFEFSKYLRHPDYVEATPTNTNNFVEMDTNMPNKTSNSADIEVFDHDSKHIYIVHNSKQNKAIPAQQQSFSAIECNDSSNNQNNAPKPLLKFVIKENFEAHHTHKVEEGIFQHMNKLPIKKKDILKQLGIPFNGQLTSSDKSIIVDNFAKFCEEYNISDHRPFLDLRENGMPKSEQIKFARYLGQGVPNFTLFCIYSNFKNLFCMKRFESFGKDTYNLQYILEKAKRFLSCCTTIADFKNPPPQQMHAPTNYTTKSVVLINQDMPALLERLKILENFDVHESHRIEGGIFTHISRLSPKKQELLKSFGIRSNHNVSYYEKHVIIENFIRFCNEYGITDHRPFLDFHESGLPKMERIKFARYVGQGLPNLALYKIYSSFKDILAMNRLEKLFAHGGYNLELLLKKKKKSLLSRMNSAASKSNQEAAKQETPALA